MRLFFISAILFAFPIIAEAQLKPVGMELYVSPAGDDANDGSESEPFKSIERAQIEVRTFIRKGLSQSISVYLDEGVYTLTEPLRFGPKDSGTETCAIIWQAKPGASVVLSGGRELTNWKHTGDSLWTCAIPEVKTGKWNFRQLFADGKRLIRARHPNSDDPFIRVEDLDDDIKEFHLSASLPGQIDRSYSSEMVVIQNWAISRADLTSIDGKVVTSKQPVGFIGHTNALITSKDKPVFFEHHPAWIDQDDEWALNHDTGELTLQSNQNPNDLAMTAPCAERLLIIEGEAQKPVRNLKFKNITFAYTRWDMPAEGYMGIQAGHFAPSTESPYRLLPGAIEWRYAVECELTNCEIAHTGANGVVLGAGCQRNAIEQCRFDDIGGNGIMVGWREGEADKRRVPSGSGGLASDWENPSDAPAANSILDNHLTNCAEQFWGCVAIFDAFAIHTHIAFNHIESMPYTGISSGYRWNRVPSSQRGGVIEYNHIHDVMTRIADGGGIYTLGWQPNAILRGNHIHDVYRSEYAHGGAPNNGIFFDQGSSGFLVEENVIYKTSGDPVRFNQCQADWQTWKNNVFRTLPGDAGFPHDKANQAGLRFEAGVQ